jgi:hypothetical protein
LPSSGGAAIGSGIIEHVLEAAHPGYIAKVQDPQLSGQTAELTSALDFKLITVIFHDAELGCNPFDSRGAMKRDLS